MDKKLELTVTKTIEALARIERFIDKYNNYLSKEQIHKILSKSQELQNKLVHLGSLEQPRES